ncbi:hypothetical protein ACIP6X_42000 [Streptomyces coeruleorubidus]|uniref:hypothetical protein n=1 Tax=Streptomyces coeruleorubidus TaxID=116188 RepID=UPI0037FA524D
MRSRKRRDGGRTSIHLLAETRRHLALVQRGRRREPGQDNRIVNEALAAHCTDITEARTERGEEPGYRFYTVPWAPAGPPPSRTPAAAPRWDRKPAADPAAPFLPLEPGEWDIPGVPLRHDRAVIAPRVLTGRLRTARRTGRPLYGPAAHQPTAPHKQLLLFAQEQPPTADTILWWQDRCWRGIKAQAAAGDVAMARLRDAGAVTQVQTAYQWVSDHRAALERSVR